ncbi:MAG: D-glycero-beta-D-manno-heptose-7-phosphate kinase [Polyangiales bacterium]
MRRPSLDSLTAQKRPRLLVIGDLMLDRYLWGACDRVSPEAPVQVVRVERETCSLGGAGNVVANLRSLGATVELLAVVGDDAPRHALHDALTTLGVDPSGLVIDPSRPTTVKTRVLAAHHQLLRFDVEHTTPCTEAQASAILDGLQLRAADVDVVVLSDYAKGVLTPALVRACIERCVAAGVPIVVDPKGRDFSHYRGATLLTPNRKEAAAATGLTLDDDAGVDAAGRKLLADHALAGCLITLSEDGMALFDGDATHHLPTEAREVFDVSGAGDTVIATVAFGLALGLHLLDACQLANRAAGIVVGKLGAATVTLEELDELEGLAEPAQPAPPPSTPQAKILDQQALIAEVGRLRAAGRRVVFTNGCFDILHAGHVRYLDQASRLGDVLIVGLNSDDSVRRLKGPSRPINREHDRALLLAALSSVSFVTVFGDDTPLALIEGVLPDVLVKGGDWHPDDIVGGSAVRAAGGRVEALPFVAGQSTTQIIARARES